MAGLLTEVRVWRLQSFWVDQWLRENVTERLGSYVLLAAAVFDGAGGGARVVETQVMAASTHCLRLGRALQRPLLLLDELGLGFENGETTTVVVLQGPATHSGDDEDEPPVTPDEILNAVHGSPFRSVPRDSGRRLHQPEVAPDPCIDGHSSHSKLLYGDMGQPDRARLRRLGAVLSNPLSTLCLPGEGASQS
jgi:hypothetical protein